MHTAIVLYLLNLFQTNHFYTSDTCWKHQKAKGFLMFHRYKIDHWLEIDWDSKIAADLFALTQYIFN